jgi:hypothetical protein
VVVPGRHAPQRGVAVHDRGQRAEVAEEVWGHLQVLLQEQQPRHPAGASRAWACACVHGCAWVCVVFVDATASQHRAAQRSTAQCSAAQRSADVWPAAASDTAAHQAHHPARRGPHLWHSKNSSSSMR